jgi:hypothetical protein
VVNALGVGQERRAEGAIANKANDIGGDVLILPLAPGDAQAGFGITSLVEGVPAFSLLIFSRWPRNGV